MITSYLTSINFSLKFILIPLLAPFPMRTLCVFVTVRERASVGMHPTDICQYVVLRAPKKASVSGGVPDGYHHSRDLCDPSSPPPPSNSPPFHSPSHPPSHIHSSHDSQSPVFSSLTPMPLHLTETKVFVPGWAEARKKPLNRCVFFFHQGTSVNKGLLGMFDYNILTLPSPSGLHYRPKK